ncbi:glutathione S-transferase 2-like [Salvia splendens]|uniref:glutathione S-transferase 2-like n=1 Tax=Salvia splendens TaxID=180675 RepID=UPI001C253F63|nr:glutathione S-transferase 2-like [Salvia splendens]XP_042027830.1 glutathione S-transferase 2-like [Salvia splendens]XP_042027831.1 glutathione S-transferase 2-like [Salvia splendens]XP_042027832.1 glutathione S-transferase 2-like [Salvia splendens]XP_042027833.1 glutathione S-transferase 2-like [Salvia splendens]XP_042027834.1 glutathione S-transferase 2-like [Salvia splendens]
MEILLFQTILLYLEERYPPQRPLLPHDIQLKALNYQAANIIFASIQPYQNVPIVRYIQQKLGADEKLSWVQHHIKNEVCCSGEVFGKIRWKVCYRRWSLSG